MNFNRSDIIIVDTKQKLLLKANDLEVQYVLHNEVIPVGTKGCKWEGDVLDSIPCGWGFLYNAEGRLMYEGFRVGDTNVCHGRYYYSDLGIVSYDGQICYGKRWGTGTQYNQKGGILYSGEWINDCRLDKKKKLVITKENEVDVSWHSGIEELILEENCCSRGFPCSTLDLRFMPRLRIINTKDYCFSNVKVVNLVGMKNLESIETGMMCFTTVMVNRASPDNRFYLKDCPKLKVLSLGPLCCEYYTVCEMENLPSLEKIEMKGETAPRNCISFPYTKSFELKSG